MLAARVGKIALIKIMMTPVYVWMVKIMIKFGQLDKVSMLVTYVDFIPFVVVVYFFLL